ncbi:MAG: DUF6737 family protein [Leptolyngbyaceae cyanobacterium bins.59]|nr:DUF6737 family protein [Leptolyngbyaceae cyanobacterium bins.59]
MTHSDQNATPPQSPWSYKPWWCQPWSIVLTGVSLIVGSWLLFKTLWLTGLLSLPVLAWMGFFLLLWPDAVMRNTVLETDQDQAAS